MRARKRRVFYPQECTFLTFPQHWKVKVATPSGRLAGTADERDRMAVDRAGTMMNLAVPQHACLIKGAYHVAPKQRPSHLKP